MNLAGCVDGSKQEAAKGMLLLNLGFKIGCHFSWCWIRNPERSFCLFFPQHEIMSGDINMGGMLFVARYCDHEISSSVPEVVKAGHQHLNVTSLAF